MFKIIGIGAGTSFWIRIRNISFWIYNTVLLVKENFAFILLASISQYILLLFCKVLYHNMKYSALACKDLTDVVRETAVLHEYNAKVRQPDRQCGTGATTLIGSFLKATGLYKSGEKIEKDIDI